jgi:hypothetical protein
VISTGIEGTYLKLGKRKAEAELREVATAGANEELVMRKLL